MSFSFGQYELLKRLASGGMGEVFLARRQGVEGFEKLVVVKTLLPHLVESQEFLTMFLDEARLAAQLDHPNIGQIFELGEVNGTYFIAMEYIAGDDVAHLHKRCLAAKTSIPIPLACRIVADAAAGLHYAHELSSSQGQPLSLVHRDVSPQNILVTYTGNVKVIDFGVAKAAGRMTHTATGQVKGKFAYMSPEQAWGQEIDRRSDVFALGIVLHELLCDQPLFKADTEVGTISAVNKCEVPPPSELNPNVEPSLERIVLKTLSREPGGRYETAEKLRLALESWLIESRQSGSQAHLASFMQRAYRKRLERIKARGPLWDVDPNVAVEPPMGFTAQAAGRRAQGSGGGAAGLWIGLAAVVLLLAGGGGAFLALRGEPAAQVTPAAGPSQAASHLSVATDPAGVSASLNGRPLGLTPIESVEVEASPASVLELSAPGLVTRKETLAISGDVRVNYAMVKAMVSIRVESEPAGATVTANGKPIGSTPMMWEAQPSEPVELRFSLDGYKASTEKVVVAEGLVVKPVLERKRRGGKSGKGQGQGGDEIPTFY